MSTRWGGFFRTLEKYGAVAAVSARFTLTQRAVLLGRCVFYCLVLFIFSRLWDLIVAQSGSAPSLQRNMLWYLAITEWILLSIPTIFLDVEKEIRNGDIAYRLPRPMSYIGAVFAEGCGALAVRMSVMGLVGFGWTCLLAGLPETPISLLAVLPVAMAASILGLLSFLTIGLSAIWLQDVSPVYWVWSKLGFILGGLLMPIEIYPEWLRTVAEYTPFYAFLYSSGGLVIHCNGSILIAECVRVVFWIIVTLAFLVWTYRKGLRALDVNGG